MRCNVQASLEKSVKWITPGKGCAESVFAAYRLDKRVRVCLWLQHVMCLVMCLVAGAEQGLSCAGRN